MSAQATQERKFTWRGPLTALNGPAQETAGNSRRTAARLLGLLAPVRWIAAGSLALTTVSVSLTVLAPQVLARVTNLVFAGELGHRGMAFGVIGRWLVIALVMYGAAALCMLGQGKLTARILARAMSRLREQAQAKLTRLPLSYFDAHPAGELLSRVTNDVDNLAETLQQASSTVLTALLTLAGVMIMMFVTSPPLVLIVAVMLPARILLARVVARRAKPYFASQWDSTGQLSAHVEEALTGHALVRAFGRGGETIAAFRGHNEKMRRSAALAQFASGLAQPAMRFTGSITFLAVAVAGGLRVTAGLLTLGALQAFLQYSQQFDIQFGQVTGPLTLLQSGLASAERIFALLSATEQVPDPVSAPAQLPRAAGCVKFEHASFSYRKEVPLIEDLSLTVEPGQSVAIVGPTGAGKTTLVNLLMRFYDVSSGRITLDGRDIRSLTRPGLRAQLGMVLQDAWLRQASIADNIADGAPGATREQVIAAARAAQADGFIQALPNGYDTILDAEGSGLSAGQKQLITIARAFLADPAVLILDEATSSVDTRTELLIRRAMASLREGRTSFVIAHRLSTIHDADLILVMDRGRIVEQGTHAQLSTSGGAYARLRAA
jgi:ATP-binding cassette, subfamily B, multidrug efflux pump